MATIKLQQVRSIIKAPKNQKLIMQALGFKRMNQGVEHEATPSILGMSKKIQHPEKVTHSISTHLRR